MSPQLLEPVGAGAAGIARELGAGSNAPAIAARGWVYLAAGLPLALRHIAPPDVSTPTVRVVACHEGLLSAERWPAVASELPRRFAANRLVVRSCLPSERLEALGLGVLQHFLTKEARPASVDGVEATPARWPDDHDYVATLMCASLRNGMPRAQFTAEQLDQYVRGFLRLGQPGGCDALIACVDGARAGTAVYRVEDDELTGERITRLVDIMTSQRGQGLALRIAPAFESHVATAGLPDRIVGTVVGEDDGSDHRTVQHLERAGWKLDHTWWTPAA